MARRKKTHNDVQNTKQKTKDQAKLKTGKNSVAPKGLAVLAPLVAPVV
jgi:hypothetical protein